MINETNQLSEREQEILQLVAAGLSNQQIANQLGISVNTVKVHLRKVFGKIGVASRTEATLYAVRNGLVAIERVEQYSSETHTDSPTEVLLLDEVEQGEVVTHPVGAAAPAPADDSERRVTGEDIAAAVPEEPVISSPPPPMQPAAVLTAPAWRQKWPLLLIAAGLLLLVTIVALQTNGLGRRNAAPDEQAVAQNLVEDEQRWQPLDPMNSPRAGFATAAVGNYIYLIGGENEQGVLDSVERYDHRSATWTSLSTKPTAVADVRAVVIGGLLYVPGGRLGTNDRQITDAFERYDPVSEEWESLPSLPAPRSAYALVAVEGKLYLFGGWDGTSYRDEVFAYDPDQDTWNTLPAMPTARGYMDAQVVGNMVYVIGGQNEQGVVANNEVFNPAQINGQPWSRRAPLPVARSRFSSAAAGSLIHVVGGEATDTQPLKYDIRTDSWNRFSFPPEAVGSQPGVVLLDELMLIFGGRDDQGAFSAATQAYQALFTVFAPYEK
jgi:DNA-binding CsgD family transcriptional regulator